MKMLNMKKNKCLMPGFSSLLQTILLLESSVIDILQHGASHLQNSFLSYILTFSGFVSAFLKFAVIHISKHRESEEQEMIFKTSGLAGVHFPWC